MERSRFSFIIKVTYDVLPTPKTVVRRRSSMYSLADTSNTEANALRCKTSRSQGCYTRGTPAIIRERRITATTALHPPMPGHQQRASVRQERTQPSLTQPVTWGTLVDLDHKQTTDLIMPSTTQKTLHILELRARRETAAEEAHERKNLRYAELAAQAEQRKC